MRTLKTSCVALAVLAMVGCGASVPGAPGGYGGSKAESVDPNTCGNYAASDTGRKLKAFLEATVRLDEEVTRTGNYARDTCAMMGRELGMAPATLEGDTKQVCDAMVAELQNHMEVGMKAEAGLELDYQPAECRVDVDAAASAAAECEANAEADVAVSCEGSCQGSCHGQCDGTCAGSAGTEGSGGECAGQCDGTCQGRCEGSCQGHADVEASAECKAQAEVYANVEAECTEPEVKVSYGADVVVDASKVEAAVRALEVGMPRLLKLQAQMSGPVMAAFQTWSKTAKNLAGSSAKLVGSLGDQARCVGGQLAAAAAMVANIQIQIEVQVEVSASVSGAASGGAAGGA